MKKSSIFRMAAAAMALALLLPCLMTTPVRAAGEATQLFQWKAIWQRVDAAGNVTTDTTNYPKYYNTTKVIDNLVTYEDHNSEGSSYRKLSHFLNYYSGGTSTTKGTRTNMSLYYLQAGVRKGDDGNYYGLPVQTYGTGQYDYKTTEGLKIQFKDLPAALQTKSSTAKTMYAINVNLTYAKYPAADPVYALDYFDVMVQVDGAWLTDTVGLRNWELIGKVEPTDTTVTGDVFLYSLETENLLSIEGLDSGDQIQDIMIRPYGSNYWTSGWFGMADVTVNGYATQAAWESAVPDGRNELLYIGGDKMRQIVYEQGNKTLDLEWKPTSNVTTESEEGVGTGSDTYEMVYSKDYTYHGPTYVRHPESNYELLRDKIKEGAITTEDTFGMDCNGFAYDTYSRISHSFGSRIFSTQNDNRIKLMEGLKTTDDHPVFTDQDIVAANTPQEMYAGYSKAQKGDLLTHLVAQTDTTASKIHVRLVAGDPTVVYKNGVIDPDNSYVPCIEQSSGVRYHYGTGENDYVTVNDVTSLVGKIQLAGKTILYGTSAMKKSYSFTDLLKDNYVPYTLAEYETGEVENIEVQSILTEPEDILSGFTGMVATDYHITKVGAVLKNMDNGTVVATGEDYYTRTQNDYAHAYTSDTLNSALKNLENGNYSLELSVQAGPVQDVGEDRPIHTQSVKFTVTDGVAGPYAAPACDHGVIGPWEELTADTAALATGTNYYLNGNVTNSRAFTVNGDVTISLNGHTLTTGAITVASGKLNICDCSDAQTGTLNGTLGETGGTICLYGGKFSLSNNRDKLASWLDGNSGSPWLVKEINGLYQIVEGFVSNGEYFNFGSSLNVSLPLAGENGVPIDDTYNVTLSPAKYGYAVETLALTQGAPSVQVLTIKGIAAKELHDEFTVTISKNDQTYYTHTLSAYEVAKNWHGAAGTSNATKTMLADMIAYGNEARKEFEYNYTEGETILPTLDGASTGTPNWGEVDSSHGVSGIPADDVAVSLSLRDKIQLNIYILDAGAEVKRIILGEGWKARVLEKGTDYTIDSASGSYIRVSIHNIDVVDVKKAVQLTATLADDTEMNMTYSIADYAIQAQNGPQVALLQAMQRYVDSVCDLLNPFPDCPVEPQYETKLYIFSGAEL